MLKGATAGKYSLSSPIQREEGPRMFYPHFGFAYKAVNTNVKVILRSSAFKIVDFEVTKPLTNTDWEYYFKDLSTTPLGTVWAGTSEYFWQIVLLFDVGTGGSISIDNMGMITSMSTLLHQN